MFERLLPRAEVLLAIVDLRPLQALCHPNRARGHWHAKSAAIKVQRGDAYWAAREMGNQAAERGLAGSRIEVEFRVRRRHDPDNLVAWLKPTIDGLCDARLLVPDRHLPVPVVRQTISSQENLGVQVLVFAEVSEIPGAEAVQSPGESSGDRPDYRQGLGGTKIIRQG